MTDTPASPAARVLEPVRAAGRRRFHQRISLEAFLRAIRIWARVVWNAVLEEVRSDRRDDLQAALSVALRLLSQSDEISTAAAEAYLDEVSSDRGLLRRDLMEAVISGRGDTEIACRRAGTLGLQLAENYLVVVLRASDVEPQDAHRPSLRTQVELDRIVQASRGRLHPTAGSLLVGMHHGDVVALCPICGPDDLAAIRRECAALLDALDDVLVDHIYRSSPCADRILADTLRPMIEYDRAHHASFVTTLRTYLGAGLNLTRTAHALFVHPNTIEYRLRRIRELSGRDPRNPDDLLILSLAIKFDELRSSSEALHAAA